MPRRHKLDKHKEAKEKAIKYYMEGMTLEEVAKRISIEYPINVSKSSIHRLISKYRDILKFKEAGIIENEDIDLLAHSQSLSQIATGLLYEILAEWSEKGKISTEKIKIMLELLRTTSQVSKSNAEVEKIKTQIGKTYETIFQKILKVISKYVDEEKIKPIIEELKNELQG